MRGGGKGEVILHEKQSLRKLSHAKEQKKIKKKTIIARPDFEKFFLAYDHLLN